MKLHVREWGTGDSVAVLIHGLFSDSRCWYRLGPALADRGYRVLAPDLRGHGASGRGRYSIVDWALDVIESLPAEPALAIGHSLGGLVLGIVAGPMRVGRAVYLDPAWRMDATQSARSREVWTSWLDWTDRERLRVALGSTWPDLDLDYRWESMQLTDPGVIAGLATPGGYDLAPERAVSPSLVLAADPSEFVVDPEVLRDRGLEVVTIQNSGHSYFREDFDGFLKSLDHWMR